MFKDIPGYIGLYKISTSGVIKNAKGMIMKSYKNDNGYEKITLFNNGKKGHYVHILLASTFIKNTDKNKNQVDHKDRKRNNNVVENLRYTTPKENSNNRG